MSSCHRPVKAGDHVFLVDGSSFVFRAYFQSIRQDAKYNYRSDRLPTGAVRLFCTKMLQFVREGAAGAKPTHLAIIFDKSENSFRKEIYPEYKANRSDPPEDLIPQFPLMREAVRAFGMIPIEQDRYEADDLIATYARQAEAKGADVLIISADKDLMQLITPKVSMYDPASGVAGSAGAREEFERGIECRVQFAQLVVDVHAHGLEGARRGIDACPALMHAGAHQGGQIARRTQGRTVAGGDDASSDVARATFFTVTPENVGDVFFARAGQPLRGRLAAGGVHAHVERPLVAETESTRGVVELR